MENLSDGGLWARWRRLGHTTPATVEADVEFHRGPAPARFAVAGFIALAISILSVVFVVYRIHEISDRSVRVQATVLGGVRNVNTGTTDLDVKYEFGGVEYREHIHMRAPTVVPATLARVVDPHDPTHSWEPGGWPPAAVNGLLPTVAIMGTGASLQLLGVARRLRRRRRRLGLHDPTQVKRCTVAADAVADVAEVSMGFVIYGYRFSRASQLTLIFIGVMLAGFGVAAVLSSSRGALIGSLWLAALVGCGIALQRTTRRSIVVSNDGLAVRDFRGQRDFLWSDIATASVVRVQPWYYSLGRFGEHRSNTFERVRVEARMMTTSGVCVPTRVARRASGDQPSELGPVPRDAAERLVVAWEQHHRRSGLFHHERELGRTARW